MIVGLVNTTALFAGCLSLLLSAGQRHPKFFQMLLTEAPNKRCGRSMLQGLDLKELGRRLKVLMEHGKKYADESITLGSLALANGSALAGMSFPNSCLPSRSKSRCVVPGWMYSDGYTTGNTARHFPGHRAGRVGADAAADEPVRADR